MSKIIGNTTATPTPRSDWNQTNETKADFILNKPVLGALSEKDTVDKNDLSDDVQDYLQACIDDAVANLGSSVEIDSTLTQADKAADAKATGDAINTLQTNVDSKLSEKSDVSHNHDSVYDAAGTAQEKADAALDSAKSYTNEKIADLASTSDVTDAISEHNNSESYAHSDIRDALKAVKEDVDTFFKDATLTESAKDTLKEIQDYIDSDVAAAATMTASINNKADKEHDHTISDVDGLQTALDGKANTSHTHTVSDITDLTATAEELNYVDGVTSNIQTQLDSKQATISGGASTIASSNLTASRALVSNSSGKVAVSAVTSTELGYLDGVTSAIQTQLDGKAASSHNHAASNITSGTLSSDRLPTVPVTKGGTGATTAKGAEYAISGGITEATADLTDDYRMVFAHTAPDATQGVFLFRKVSTVWNYLKGKLTGAISTVLTSNLTASRALISNSSGKVAVSAVTSTELGYLDGVTSAIQTQLDGKLSTSTKYAASSSVGGAATSAAKLTNTSDIGSATQPVYFNANGVPVATTYTLGKSVPSDAVFTDTKYTHPQYTAKSSGLYKITVDSTGHVSAATAVAKSDITALGIPAQDTTYSLSSFGITATAAELNKLDGVTATATEINYIDGVTSNIQTQLNKRLNISDIGTAIATSADLNNHKTPGVYYATAAVASGVTNSPYTSSGFKLIVMTGYNASRFVQMMFTNNNLVYYRHFNSSTWGAWSKLTPTTLSDLGITATAAELNYVDGVTSAIQTQLNGKSSTARYTATVGTGWTASGSYYYKDVTVTGILATDYPIVDINPGSDNAANALYSEAICKVFRITTSADSIRLWATEAIATSFPIQLKVVR